MEWKCFDGTNGRIFSSETTSLTSHVTQIVPLRSSTHHPHDIKSCCQVALLVHSDNTVSVLPNTARSYAIVGEAILAANRNGLFVHNVDRRTGEFRAHQVSRKSGEELKPGLDPFELVTVGATIFDPSQETVVNVAVLGFPEILRVVIAL